MMKTLMKLNKIKNLNLFFAVIAFMALYACNTSAAKGVPFYIEPIEYTAIEMPQSLVNLPSLIFSGTPGHQQNQDIELYYCGPRIENAYIKGGCTKRLRVKLNQAVGDLPTGFFWANYQGSSSQLIELTSDAHETTLHELILGRLTFPSVNDSSLLFEIVRDLTTSQERDKFLREIWTSNWPENTLIDCHNAKNKSSELRQACESLDRAQTATDLLGSWINFDKSKGMYQIARVKNNKIYWTQYVYHYHYNKYCNSCYEYDLYLYYNVTVEVNSQLNWSELNLYSIGRAKEDSFITLFPGKYGILFRSANGLIVDTQFGFEPEVNLNQSYNPYLLQN